MMRRVEWIGYAGVALLVSAALLRALVMDSGPLALGLAVTGGALFLVYFFRAGASVEGFLHRRSTRAGGNVFAISLFVLGIVVVINVLAANFRTRVDLTEGRLFTVSPETAEALRKAPAPPEVWVFYPEPAPVVAQLRTLLEAARAVEPRLRYHILDPGREPLEAARFDLRQFATVVQVGDRREQFTGGAEEDFLAALTRTYRSSRGRIGFLEGHGEPLLTDDGVTGLSRLMNALLRRDYQAGRLDLLAGDAIQGRFDVVAVIGPRRNLSSAEVDSLSAFLTAGGRLLLALDPARTVTLDPLLARAGLRFGGRFLEDPDQRDPQVIHPAEYSRHPVVRPLGDRGLRVVFPGVAEIEDIVPPEGTRRAGILRTGQKSVVAGDDDSVPRSRSVASAGEWGTDGAPGRMVVFGDADFAGNNLFEVLGNGDLLLNTVQWLAEQDDMISIRPRNIADRPVVLSRQQGRALLVLLTGLLPLGVLSAGAVVWWRRR